MKFREKDYVIHKPKNSTLFIFYNESEFVLDYKKEVSEIVHDKDYELRNNYNFGMFSINGNFITTSSSTTIQTTGAVGTGSYTFTLPKGVTIKCTFFCTRKKKWARFSSSPL